MYFVQLSSSGSKTGNANSHTPFIDLEDVIGSYEQRASGSKQSDIIEKLKALQLVEQMIKNHEHMLQTQQSNESINNQTTMTNESHSSPPRPVLNAWAETSPRKSQSPPPAPVKEPLSSSNDSSKLPRSSTLSKSAAELKTEQLKLLNAKIAQRHSKDSQKASEDQDTSNTSKAKKANPQVVMAKAKPKSITHVSKPIVKFSKLNPQQSAKKKQLHPKKTTTTGQSTSKIPVTKASHPNETTITRPIVPSVLSQPVTAPLQPTPSKHEPSVRVSRPLTSTIPINNDDDGDLLASSSYYVPLSEDALETPLDIQFQTALEQDSTLVSSDFASSLTQAYGMSSEVDSSQVLSMLWKEGSKSVSESSREGWGNKEPGPGLKLEPNKNELKENVMQNSIHLQG